MKETIMFAVVLGFLLVISACKDTSLTSKEPQSQQRQYTITPGQCKAAGGNWNECGSPCAGTDAEVCIQVCSPQCECGGITGFSCPKGYRCRLTGRISDEMGVCVEE